MAHPVPVLIAPFKTGIDTDVSPWIAPLDSFETLNNFHVRHGYIQKRNGFRIFGRMVHNAPAPNGTATITGISNADPAVVSATNTFVDGDQVLITGINGTTEVNGRLFTVANRTGADFQLSGLDSLLYGVFEASPNGRADLFDGDRIMGIQRYYLDDGSLETLVFDTKRVSVYDAANNRFNPLDAVDVMSGDDEDYIWSTNWQNTAGANTMYFTNGKVFDSVMTLDGIRKYSSTVIPAATITESFVPVIAGTRSLYGCKLIFTIKQRLVCLFTFENDSAAIPTTTEHPQRARWCQKQNPNNWDDLSAGGGQFLDAATGEQIISARALQDVIIVFFTNSVWRLRYLPDPDRPFRWEKINDFRACEGKMATVQYDKSVVGLGIRGITSTDGVETKRIDDRIQNFTTNEVNVDEFKKVFCARDYTNNRWWTLYAAVTTDDNSKALIFDEDSGAFSEYEISMNCIGYGVFGIDYTLDDFILANNLDKNLQEVGDATLQSYFWQKDGEAFLGGDISGNVFVLGTDGTDNGSEISCDFKTNAWNPFQAEGREAQLNYLDIYVEVDKNTKLLVEFFKDTDVSPYLSQSTDILPPLEFVTDVSQVSKDNPVKVTASQHGLTTGDTIFIYGVLGMVEIDGEYTVTVGATDPNSFTLDGIDGSLFTTYTSGGQVVRKEYHRIKSWKRVHAGGIGFQHRVRISSTGLNQPLKIECLKPYFKPIGRRTIN